MDSDQSSIFTKFETAKQILEGDINGLVKENDQLSSMQTITLEQQNITKQQTKESISRISKQFTVLDKSAKGDQKLVLSNLKKKYVKEVERHKAIMRDLAKQSFLQFDRLSLKGSVAKTQSRQSNYFVEQNPSLSPSPQIATKPIRESQQELSIHSPLMPNKLGSLSGQNQLSNGQIHSSESEINFRQSKTSSQQRDTQELEAQHAQYLNEMIQKQSDQYEKDLDLLQQSKEQSNCFKISLILSISVLILLLGAYLCFHFLY